MKTRNDVPLVPGLRALADAYDGFILDLWGTLHDGLKPLSGAIDCLSQLRARGKRVLILSNAPRRNHSVAERMHRIGIPEGLYDGVLASGEAAHIALRDGIDDWHRNLGRDCFIFGAGWDGSVLEDLDIRRVGDVRAASFILAIGPGRAGQTVADFEADLAAGAARGLPMLCANPDLEVLRGPDREICAGALAARYQELGGDVRQHGKPYAPIYAMALERLGVEDRARVLAVGDSLRTDIAGAAASDLDSLLIAGGIHAASLGVEGLDDPDPARLNALYADTGVRPSATCAAFRW